MSAPGLSVTAGIKLQNGQKAFQPVFPTMVLRLRVDSFPQSDITASNDPDYPDNRLSTLLSHLVRFGKIIKSNIKINGTLKSLQ